MSKSGFSRIGAGGKKRYGKRGAGLFMTDGEVVLLLKRKPPSDEPNTWAIPGGKVKNGESDIDAARRETKEESGDLPSSMVRISDFTDRDGHHIFKTYLMRIDQPYKVKLSDESSDHEWVSLSKFGSKNLHPGVRRIWPAVARAISSHFGKKAMNFKEWLTLSEATALDQNHMKVVEKYLADVEKAGYRLIAHQTSDDQALKIIKSEDFSDRGVDGTALWANHGQIRAVVEKMNAFHNDDMTQYRSTGGVVHKGSNAVLVMAVPAKLPIKGLRDLDDYLIDLYQAGKINSFGIPNQYIVGYWQWDGQFFANGKFKPKGLL